MKEIVEFRIPEHSVREYFPTLGGISLGGTVRKVVVDTSDPLFRQIGEIEQRLRKRNKFFFHGVVVRRRYTRMELKRAEFFHGRPRRMFEPTGEECGTKYDESKACSVCGAGAVQVGPLVLDGRSLPKRADFARTLVDTELVVTRRVADAFQEAGLAGCTFAPILLRNKQMAATDQYFQLCVGDAVARVHPVTRAGEHPFDTEAYGACPQGHVIGLNLLSEVTLIRGSVPGNDVFYTSEMVGTRQGYLRPCPLLLLSQRAMQVVRKAGLRGLVVEVAHSAASGKSSGS